MFRPNTALVNVVETVVVVLSTPVYLAQRISDARWVRAGVIARRHAARSAR